MERLDLLHKTYAMKNLMLILGAALISQATVAQNLKEAEVPSAVQAAFKSSNAGASSVKWEKEGENYEAEFRSGGLKKSVLLNAEGATLETETEINTQELPAGIKEYLANHYSGMKISEASTIISASGELTYEVELKDLELIFDGGGSFVKEIKEDKDKH